MQNFKELYKELADKIAAIESVEWIDLWNSQVYNLEDELPFPAPAVFLAFRSNTMGDMGDKVQNVTMQVDVFLFWETFADTYREAYNQAAALQFLDTIDALNKLLHGSSGEQYSSMRRVSFSPLDTGGAGNLYSVTYNCELVDYSAQPEYGTGGFSDMAIEPADDGGRFIIE